MAGHPKTRDDARWSFGELDFDAIGLEPERPAPSGVDAERTQIAGSALARPLEQAGGSIVPPPASGTRGLRAASDVAPRRQDVVTMRELYARGDADAALAIAAELAASIDASGLTLLSPSVDANAADTDREDSSSSLAIIVDLEETDDRDERTVISASPDSRRLVAITSERIPRMRISPREIPSLPIDPRAAFLLGHVDGIQSMRDILDICAMPESEAIALFERLQSLGVISIE